MHDLRDLTAKQADAIADELVNQIVHVDIDRVEEFLTRAVEWRLLARELEEAEQAT